MSDNLHNHGGDSAAGATPPPIPSAPPPASPPVAANAGNWERAVLEKLVFATLREQKSARRWGIFFKSVTLLVLVVALATYLDVNWTGSEETLGRHTALIEIEGAIESEGSGAAAVVIPALNKAFSDNGSVAVVLHINSPGGSPVQAGMIVDEMQRHDEHQQGDRFEENTPAARRFLFPQRGKHQFFQYRALPVARIGCRSWWRDWWW